MITTEKFVMVDNMYLMEVNGGTIIGPVTTNLFMVIKKIGKWVGKPWMI